MKKEFMEKAVDNYGLAFFSFYLVFPFISKEFEEPSIPLGTVAVLLMAYFRAKNAIYRHYRCREKLFLNSLIMVLGLAALYSMEVLFFEYFHGYHLMIYFLLSFTYLPSALQAERCKKMFTDSEV